ncbi:MAG TPA: hypothetical protein VJX67_10750 [Blastocatellia bacterium]|nr:hypothetical protein [Blastocatellia bacterium]
MSAQELNSILEHIRRLSRMEQTELARRITEMLATPDEKARAEGLVYGKYASAGQMSTEEDFKEAEWRPSEAELNGR